MSPTLTDGATDEFHAGDWPLTEDGFLVPALLTVDRSNPLQAIAHDLAARLYSVLPGIHAVYLRGSTIESTRLELVRDVDMIVVLGTSDDHRQELERVTSGLWPTGKELPRCDVASVRLDRIRAQPFSALIQLVLAFRASLLVGLPVWDETPSVKADRELASRCQDRHRRLVTRFIDKACAAPHHFDPSFLVSWMQKKALRLGGVLAMGLSGRLSRHPVRCSMLISESYPKLSELATRVAGDYIVGRADEAAWRAARGLFCALAKRGDELSKASDQQLTGLVEMQ